LELADTPAFEFSNFEIEVTLEWVFDPNYQLEMRPTQFRRHCVQNLSIWENVCSLIELCGFEWFQAKSGVIPQHYQPSFQELMRKAALYHLSLIRMLVNLKAKQGYVKIS